MTTESNRDGISQHHLKETDLQTLVALTRERIEQRIYDPELVADFIGTQNEDAAMQAFHHLHRLQRGGAFARASFPIGKPPPTGNNTDLAAIDGHELCVNDFIVKLRFCAKHPNPQLQTSALAMEGLMGLRHTITCSKPDCNEIYHAPEYDRLIGKLNPVFATVVGAVPFQRLHYYLTNDIPAVRWIGTNINFYYPLSLDHA